MSELKKVVQEYIDKQIAEIDQLLAVSNELMRAAAFVELNMKILSRLEELHKWGEYEAVQIVARKLDEAQSLCLKVKTTYAQDHFKALQPQGMDRIALVIQRDMKGQIMMIQTAWKDSKKAYDQANASNDEAEEQNLPLLFDVLLIDIQDSVGENNEPSK